MKKLLLFCVSLFLFTNIFNCSDPCREAADKVKDCLERFCEKYGKTTDTAKMKCNTFYTICPNGENQACGFDYDKCSRNNLLSEEILNGECDENTGEIKKK
ncbi:MAG: hypothetical protein N2746_04195 [Deltaproteobacteria bacterium]|nr:hypothetical protein [Deltaproteobacteria bacterium]